uniref:Uncharacterized protein n=1 Tax=Nonomuraea gerenzanensis TaxID=93944 RepID=A0A1M4EH39_9ACTN|nr:hypothetical protein BN4615_P7646 [Nonomuraea gerenzanensis]
MRAAPPRLRRTARAPVIRLPPRPRPCCNPGRKSLPATVRRPTMAEAFVNPQLSDSSYAKGMTLLEIVRSRDHFIFD